MVQIAVLVTAVAVGIFARSWRPAWRIVTAVFVIATAVQTPLVIKNDDIDSPIVYWGIQVLTLLVGLGIARALTVRRNRRLTLG